MNGFENEALSAVFPVSSSRQCRAQHPLQCSRASPCSSFLAAFRLADWEGRQSRQVTAEPGQVNMQI